MKIGIPKEIVPEESRVAAVPETVAKMIKAGWEVVVESGAGARSYIEDQDYEKVGAKIAASPEMLFDQAEIVLKVQRPLFNDKKSLHELDLMKANSILLAPLFPTRHPELLAKLNAKKITSFSLDMVPRIARAQSMDILSSMSNIAGYKSVIMAANYLGKLFPMMTTAAGTILPAKIIVIGAGVAGLQAIATARRLGGVVLAFDTRPIAEEQVQSLGAEFVCLQTSHAEAQDAGGYAKEQSADFYQQEQAVIQQHLKEADVVISTALIPGKPAPLLITAEMVKTMKQGAVIVDLAVEQGGNCALTKPGEIIIKHGVTLIGVLNVPGTLPIHASQLYSRNLFAFLNHINPQRHVNQWDFTDEIIKSCLITHQGETVHPSIQQVKLPAG